MCLFNNLLITDDVRMWEDKTIAECLTDVLTTFRRPLGVQLTTVLYHLNRGEGKNTPCHFGINSRV